MLYIYHSACLMAVVVNSFSVRSQLDDILWMSGDFYSEDTSSTRGCIITHECKKHGFCVASLTNYELLFFKLFLSIFISFKLMII